MGGLLADHLKVFIISGIPFVFLVSAVLRCFSAFLMSQIKEPRAKKEYKLWFVFKRAVAVHPETYAESLVNIVVKTAKRLR